MIAVALPDQIDAVEAAQADVGDQQIVGADRQQALRGVVGRRARDEMPGVTQQLDQARQRVLVVVEDQDSER